MIQLKRTLGHALLVAVLLGGGHDAFATAPKKKPSSTSSKSSEADSNFRLYRYKNNEGVLVTSSTIAPEFARKGYQIVTMSGVVLETVPAEPTPEERAAYEKAQVDKVNAARQQEKDKELLLRYSTIEEIEVAKKRKLAEIDDKIRMLNANISTLNQQIKHEQQQAAMFERNGQPVPAATVAKINGLEQELKVSESQLSSRQQELQEETKRFEADIARFGELEKLNLRGP